MWRGRRFERERGGEEEEEGREVVRRMGRSEEGWRGGRGSAEEGVRRMMARNEGERQ